MTDGVLQVKLLGPDGRLPTKGSDLAAGYDLYSAEDLVLHPGSKALISTQIAVAIPPGYYGRMAPRSSLAWNGHIDVGAGVIDADYRGEINVLLFNLCDPGAANSSIEGYDAHIFHIQKGDRIAQLIITKIGDVALKQVNELSDTRRGEGGFGSTGK